jgi:ADP-ribosylglycohydrolase
VGIAVSAEDPAELVDRVVEASSLTHNTGVALAGAAAVAAAVSAGLDGASVPEAVEVAVSAARLAAGLGHWVAAADVAERIVWATGLVRARRLRRTGRLPRRPLAGRAARRVRRR